FNGRGRCIQGGEPFPGGLDGHARKFALSSLSEPPSRADRPGPDHIGSVLRNMHYANQNARSCRSSACVGRAPPAANDSEKAPQILEDVRKLARKWHGRAAT